MCLEYIEKRPELRSSSYHVFLALKQIVAAKILNISTSGKFVALHTARFSVYSK